MNNDPRKAALAEHRRWLDYIQPQSEGLVVSPAAMVDSQVQLDIGGYARVQEQFLDALDEGPDGQALVEHFATFARRFLEWDDELLAVYAVTDEVPDILRATTGEHGDLLTPSAAYKYFKPAEPARPYLLLVKQLPLGTDFDQQPDAKKERGWLASAHQKFERLLRETNVPIGVLCNGQVIRLVYSPKGENSGWLSFPVAFMSKIEGRAVASALKMLLSHRRLVNVAENSRLPAVLKRSREYQANVSTELSSQVLGAMYELARGFQAADDNAHGELLKAAWERDPQEIYGGLITALLRTVFLLYAEDRGLMPTGEVYQSGYSVQSLFSQLRADQERYTDTMDDRYGAWPRLLVLFRAVFGGCWHPALKLPARRGHLFDPDRYPFLEGRPDARQELGETLPRISDGCVYRVLNLLLYLDGERLSYRTLDVEQIGSVYQTIMGFHVEKAKGRCIALKPKKKHGAPVHIDLDHLLTLKGSERGKVLKDQAETALPAKATEELKAGETPEDVLAALEKRIDRRATPHPAPAGSIILQPTDERRRSGSHYTPRSFTEPIVRKTLEPILERLGRHPRPEVILDLKIADIAVGSAAFLVETCRQLAEELVAAWQFHKCLPVIPPDEDEVLVARRLIAQRCLYGVDRNPMAVDLAKLSLWLTTMAKDHPFTFLDHAIKCGDSLVGLTNQQIGAFHWDFAKRKAPVFGEMDVEKRIRRVSDERRRILEFPEDSEAAVMKKREFLAAADDAAESIRNAGDLVIAAFFGADRDKERERLRADYLERYVGVRKDAKNLAWLVETLRDLRGGVHLITPFHWEIEFPEVFDRKNRGFDVIVGNPPFAGIVTVGAGAYPEYLRAVYVPSGGKSDLVAFFYRKAYDLLAVGGGFGLIATKTICQGDTRETGLAPMLKGGGNIHAARRRVPWPGDAAVIVSVVHVTKGKIDGSELDGAPVRRISAFLVAGDVDNTPSTTTNDKDGILSGLGNKPNGKGFIFEDRDNYVPSFADMRSLLDREPRSRELIRGYIGGSDLNSLPTLSAPRYILDFGSLDESQAKAYPNAYELIRSTVMPHVTRKNWWQHEHQAKDVIQEIARRSLKRVIVCAYTSDTLAFILAETGFCFGDSVVIFSTDELWVFALLQSRMHEMWVRTFASTLKDDVRYVPNDCFYTFPFPDKRRSRKILEAAGRDYSILRADIVVRNNEGLTKTYNRFHDPDETSPEILRLRELHSAMDLAVLDAYEWTDIQPTCEFILDYEDDEDTVSEDDGEGREGKGQKRKKPWRYRWPDEVRDQVLARLLALNQKRHEEEVRLGIAPGMKKTKAAVKKPRKAKGDPDSRHGEQPELGIGG